MERVLGTEVEEQITELAPNVHLPYDDDAEVETSWDETEDCLPDGTWVKKKTTTTSVRPPPEGTTSFRGYQYHVRLPHNQFTVSPVNQSSEGASIEATNTMVCPPQKAT